MAWQQLCIEPGTDDPQDIERAVEELGALSVCYEDAADEPLLEPAPGTTPMWRKLRLTALFDEQTDSSAIDVALRERGIASGTWSRLEDRAWERAWLDDFGPMHFGASLWVCPHGQAAPGEGTIVYLDPGLAFGTGHHTTTALCLEWLAMAQLDDTDVLDYGCGSGLLGIAAAKLGARHVVGVDIDAQALTATVDNARANQVAMTTYAPADLPAMQADIVLANILAGPLTELAPALAAMTRPDGHVVLSGILDEQAGKVRETYCTWFEMEQPTCRAGWARLTGVRNVHPVS